MNISQKQIDAYFAELNDLPEALEAIALLQEAEGNLEDAGEAAIKQHFLNIGLLAKHQGNLDAAFQEFLTSLPG